MQGGSQSGSTMNNVGGHIAILAGAGVAAFALAVLVHPSERTETAASVLAPVVVVPPRRTGDPALPSSASDAPGTGAPRSRGSLARELQIELRRVGCYADEVNGTWTMQTRRAMKSFTDKVNATLPVDKPDEILLALVKGQREPVCEADRLRDAPDAAAPKLLVPPTPATAAPRLLLPPTPATRTAPKVEESSRPPAKHTDRTAGPPQAQLPAGPVPAVGVYERRERRSARPSPQLRYARSLLRSVQRAATAPLRLP